MVAYPKEKLRSPGCSVIEVSFRTPAAIQLLEETGQQQPYQERMTRCVSADINDPNRRVSIYLGRGYKANQLYVYQRVKPEGKVYLVNLSTNVSIADFEHAEEVVMND